MKNLAILAVFVSLGIGSAAYLTTTSETRTVTIEIPYQEPIYEEVSVPYEEPVYKTVDKTTYVQKTETMYKDETQYKTVTRYKQETRTITYYSGWLQQPITGEIIYFSRATNYNCEYGGTIGFPSTMQLYTCTIYGGPNAGTYAPIYDWNAEQETETVATTRVPYEVKEAYTVQVPYEVTVSVPETVQEKVIDHYETKYKTEKRIKGYETKYRTETGEVTKTKFEWLFLPKITSLDDNSIQKISVPTPTTTTPPAISYSETRVLKGASTGNYYYKVIPEGFTIYLPSDSGGILSFKVWNDQGICYYCNTDNTIYYPDSSLHLATTAKDVDERFTSSIYNTKRELIRDDKTLLSQGIAGGDTVEIRVQAGTSSVTLTTSKPIYNMFMGISDIRFNSNGN